MTGKGALVSIVGLMISLSLGLPAWGTTKPTGPGVASKTKAPELGPGGIYKGDGYSRARRKLIRQGWKPVVTHFKNNLGDEMRLQAGGEDLIKAGYKEIQYCAGTEVGACLFNFKKGRICLRIQTLGEYAPGKYDVAVNAWNNKCPDADASAWEP